MGKGNFTVDRQSKYDTTASCIYHFDQIYPVYNATFTELDKDGNEVPFGSSAASITAHIDLLLHLDLPTTSVTYSMEIKERWGKYTSNCYGEEGQPGWVYNIEKDNWLLEQNELGRIPLYANLYPDDVIRIWNINKVDKSHRTTLPIKKINTDPDSPRVEQERIELWNKDGKTIRRIKG